MGGHIGAAWWLALSVIGAAHAQVAGPALDAAWFHGTGAGVSAAAAADNRPNVIIIMADDMGYSDIGAYGGEIRTPNLDALAAGGVRFSQFYNTARCCPTRASMLTGLYPHQAGLKFNNTSLNRNGATIAEHLRAAGYSTAMSGKWHLSSAEPKWQLGADQLKWLNHQIQHDPFSAPWTYPYRRGFQEHFGIIWGVANYFDPFSLVRNDKAINSVPSDFYLTDAISENAVRFIDEFSKQDKPFFLYTAFTCPHWPLQARPEDIARYENTYTAGWDSLRAARYRRLVNKGIITPSNTVLSPMVQDQPWTAAADKVWNAHNMAVHAAMVDRMDQGIGAIIRKLKDAGEFDNTLIFFFSDNGASPERYELPGFDRPSELRDGTPIQYTGKFMAGPANTNGYIGPMWANAANTPFRYWKKESYEGGICTPFIVHWPAGLHAAAGSINRNTGHVIDLLPTILEAAGAKYPETLGGHKLLPPEGTSMLSVLNGGVPKPRALYWEHEGGRAVRVGDWKLVSLANRAWELYNLATDRTETVNLASKYPARTDSLATLWTAWNARVNKDAVIPVAIELLAPADGQPWNAGSAAPIRWATTGGTDITAARLEFNDGTGWKVIADSIPHNGEYAWSPPAGSGKSLRIRVSVSLAGKSYSDENQVPVAVGSAPRAARKVSRVVELKRGRFLIHPPGEPSAVRDLSGKRNAMPQSAPAP